MTITTQISDVPRVLSENEIDRVGGGSRGSLSPPPSQPNFSKSSGLPPLPTDEIFLMFGVWGGSDWGISERVEFF